MSSSPTDRWDIDVHAFVEDVRLLFVEHGFTNVVVTPNAPPAPLSEWLASKGRDPSLFAYCRVEAHEGVVGVWLTSVQPMLDLHGTGILPAEMYPDEADEFIADRPDIMPVYPDPELASQMRLLKERLAKRHETPRLNTGKKRWTSCNGSGSPRGGSAFRTERSPWNTWKCGRTVDCADRPTRMRSRKRCGSSHGGA